MTAILTLLETPQGLRFLDKLLDAAKVTLAVIGFFLAVQIAVMEM